MNINISFEEFKTITGNLAIRHRELITDLKKDCFDEETRQWIEDELTTVTSIIKTLRKQNK